MPSSSATTADVFAALAAGAAAESPLWAEALLPEAEQEREPVFSPLVDSRFALGLETIYEGYLLHYGRPRLFAPPDGDVALLLGDYLYAHGLVRIAATGDLDAVATLAELISACAALRAEGATDGGDEWLRAAERLGGSRDGGAAAARARAAHARRLS